MLSAPVPSCYAVNFMKRCVRLFAKRLLRGLFVQVLDCLATVCQHHRFFWEYCAILLFYRGQLLVAGLGLPVDSCAPAAKIHNGYPAE